jgi:hypothetical protein
VSLPAQQGGGRGGYFSGHLNDMVCPVISRNARHFHSCELAASKIFWTIKLPHNSDMSFKFTCSSMVQTQHCEIILMTV